MNKKSDLTNGDISKQIKMIAVPASVGFFFNTMYNVVDTYFAGLVSTDALAAMSLSFPVFFILLALGSGVGTGATALISNALGAKDEKKANAYGLQALSFGVITGLILTVLGYIVAPSLFMLLGAEGVYLDIAVSYINVILLSAVFFVLTFVMNGILNARGDTVTYRNFLIVGFFLNCFLNPLFMFGWFGLPAMGLIGIAWATFVVKFIGTVYMSYALYKNEIFCKDCINLLRPRLQYFKDIARQGFPASLNMMTIAVGIFIITYFIAPFGKTAVAAYGIATRIDQVALLPVIGLNIATLTLIGQNNGAGQFDRCVEVFKKTMTYGFYLTTVGVVLVFFLAGPLMKLFTDDVEIVKIGVDYLHISVFMYWAYTILFIVVSALQGLKKPNFALWIGTFRQIAAPICIFYVFSQIFGWELHGIWWGMLIINWSAVVISLVYVRSVMKKIFVPKDAKKI